MWVSRFVAIGILATVVGWILFSAITGREFEAQKPPLEVVEGSGFAVTVEESQAQEFVRRVSLRGLVEADSNLTLAFETTGRVLEVLVERGDQVAEGDTIAIIDDRDVRANQASAQAALAQAEAALVAAQAGLSQALAGVPQANATYASAEAALEQAERDLATQEALAEEGFSSGNRLANARTARDQAEAALAQAASGQASAEAAVSQAEAGLIQSEASVAQARAGLESAESQLDKTRLLAPVVGTIEEVVVEVGDFVGPQSPALRLINREAVLVQVDAPIALSPALSVGMSALVGGAAELPGTLTYLAGEVDQATNTFGLEVSVANLNAQLRDGQSVDVELALAPQVAHRVGLDIFLPNAVGEIGVKYVLPGESLVRFHPANIDNTVTEGSSAWITGMPETVNLIVTGAGFVQEGEEVQARTRAEVQALLDEHAFNEEERAETDQGTGEAS